MPSFDRFLKVYWTDLVTSGRGRLVVDPVRVEIFDGPRSYSVVDRVSPPIVRAGVERTIATVRELVLPGGRTYIELIARVSDAQGQRQYCEERINRVVAQLSSLYSPGLFSQEVWSGWISNEKKLFGDMWIRLEQPVDLDYLATRAKLADFQATLTSDADIDTRFSLMAKLFARSIALPPGEERFLWLWTVLEVYPMQDTTNIRPIGDCLAGITGRPYEVVMSKLGIGRLFGARSDLVHQGLLGYDIASLAESLKRLEAIVLCVMRSLGGLPYAGSLEEHLS